MYNRALHTRINEVLQQHQFDIAGEDNAFYARFIANATAIHHLFEELYSGHPRKEEYVSELINLVAKAYQQRSEPLKQRDEQKESGLWFLSNGLVGTSLYVDRFCGDISNLVKKLDYFQKLGVNLLHLMPLFESPMGESDGGYAISDFRKLDPRFGTLADLQELQHRMQKEDMYLMLDIVLNHTSHRHHWAEAAKAGDPVYQQYFHVYPDRVIPDQFEESLPDVFPDSAPGNFTYNVEMKQWVMTVFHQYQWDLNFSNPRVFLEMLDNIFFYANLGVDVLRIDAPAFIWKQVGTNCQNLPQAHTLLRLIKQCVHVAAPGMALLAEAIVSPREIMKYFGTGNFIARECDLAYNATHMALQWDALATADTRVMLAAQHELLQKPYGTSWITYTRCHDDIGLGYDDYMIQHGGYEPAKHRKFLQEYYSGSHPNTPAIGALFSVNPRTNDARISGTLASLCGLEKAIQINDAIAIDYAIRRIILMQAHSLFIGGIPMLFYGDEVGYTNDYSYQSDAGKHYDNRWMHRPMIDWEKNKKIEKEGTVEDRIFAATQKLIVIRKKIAAFGDHKNLTWLTPYNIHVAGYLRTFEEEKVYCLFNFSDKKSYVSWRVFREHGPDPASLVDEWTDNSYTLGGDPEYIELEAYQFLILQACYV
ncbi:MAG: alpha-amylase [Chitinophagaceae bacterium]|nr:alpha-amylase [Chitinophagaceae bacterium]